MKYLKYPLLLLSLLMLTLTSSAQSKAVTLSLQNVTIRQAIVEIERSTRYVFFFSDEINTSLNKKISVKAQNEPIESVLNKILGGSGISYTVQHDRQVSLFPVSSAKASASTNSGDEKPRVVGGVVVDTNGDPLIGVTVKVLGTEKGTVTDVDGNFQVEVKPSDTLEFSYVGFVSQQAAVGDINHFNIVMSEAVEKLEDVVVVGYGTQKKETVTGSVSTITTKDLLQSPQANLSNALAGRLPGILSVQRSGEPGNDQSTLRVRGVGTFAGESSQNPLIMVDGVEVDDMNNIDPNEVLSLTVLKDASATAVYGVRGANGVILITTKRGELGKPKISFSSNVAVTSFVTIPQNLSSYDYTRLYNEAQAYDYYYAGSYNPRFSGEAIEKYRTGSDPLYYPDTDWYDYMLKDCSTQTQNNFNVRGGTERVKYFVSLGFFTQDGLLNTSVYDPGYDYQINYKRYNMRSNFDINVTKNLLLKIDVSNQMGNVQRPNWSTNQIMEALSSTPSIASPGVVDNMPVTVLETSGYTTMPAGPLTHGYSSVFSNNLNFSGRFEYKMDYLLKGLSLRGAISYKNYNTENKTYVDRGITYDLQRTADGANVFVPSTDPGKMNYQGTTNRNNRIYSEVGVEYKNRFGDHNVTGLILYDQGKYYSPSLEYNVPNGYQGLVGRTTYGFKDRYLAEFDMGYNGTENFAPGKRFGFFPAFSAGWIISEEPFMPESKILSFWKIRASYGTVGNDKIGGARFLYLPSAYVYEGSAYYWGEVGKTYTGYQGSSESKAGNPDLTWEKAFKWNIGTDIHFWEDKIALTGDFFVEHRNNILCNRNTVPVVIGIESGNLPAYNMGRMRNSGFDGELAYNDHFGNVDVFVKGNFTYAHNVILAQDEVVRNEDYLYRTGQSYGQFFGYIADGLFNTWEEVNAAGRPEYVMANNNNKIQPGDVRYVDVNGDGKINEDDQVPIGYSTFPEIMYGLSMGGKWKNFDFSVMFQGAAHVSNMPSRRTMRGFFENTGAREDMKRSWSEERWLNGEEIVYPRLGTVGVGHNYLTSTYWLEDASYLRLKNAEIGYSLNGDRIQRLGIGSIRLYMNGSNLLTFCHMLPGEDPEVLNLGANNEPYPVTRICNFGININF